MRKSRWSMVLGIVSLAGALAGLSGCNHQGTDGTPSEAASELGAAPEGARDAKGHAGMHARGPAMLLGAALHELDLTDAQRATIQAEIDALRPSEADRAGHDAARKALADAVRSGKVDEAALLAQLPKPQIDTARVAKAIGVLHATLSPAQRKELVDEVLAKMDRKGGPDGEPGQHGRHGERGDDDAKGERGRHGERGPGMHGPLGFLLRGIDLTDSQREAVRAAIEKTAPARADRDAKAPSHEAFREAMRERLSTFANDSFDAAAFVAMPEGAPKFGPEARMGHMVKVLAAVTPILDETQRAEVAKRIEQGPMGPPHMGKGKHRAPEAEEAE